MNLKQPNGEPLTPTQRRGLGALALVAGISFLLFVVRPRNMGLMAFGAFLALQAVSGVLFCVGGVIAIRLLFGAPGRPGLVRKAADWLTARGGREPRQQQKAA